MKYIKPYKIFETISISDIEIGSIILFQGSKYEVINKDDFSVSTKSVQTGNKMTINQGQIDEYGIKMV